MSKNLIPQIAQMLGVELGEEFKIKGYDELTYKFDNDGLRVSCGNGARKFNPTANTSFTALLAVAIDILWNDFGGLQRKDQRLKFFAETFRERLEVVDQGFTPTQQAAMDELQRQAGYSVVFNTK